MSTLFLLFLTDPEGGGSGFTSLIFLAAIFLVFYLFIIRPQSKKQKEIQNKVSEMKKGDKVVTSGGVIGIVASIEDDSIMMEIDKDVKVKLLKNAIVDVNPKK
ncbi:MAG: preprotein translocase subunit YajC [Cyclonatronaceae bacterium]